MNQPPDDRPKLLGDPTARATRQAQLFEPHVAPLTHFVDELRTRMDGQVAGIPYFDPWDGGVDAEVLYLLEAPGAKAVASEFISRNNPDETAKNFFELNIAAGIPRRQTVTWNIVPWYIGTGARIRPATSSDIQSGLEPLRELLALLPRLRAVVFVGQKAAAGASLVARLRPDLRRFITPHPSPLFVNNKPGNRERILAVLQDVASFLRDHEPAV
jgi:uracil-DNA glycosylase